MGDTRRNACLSAGGAGNALLAYRTDNAMDSTRAALEEHWRASESGETEVEHAIYAADAILDYPQSGERFRGRTTIAAHVAGTRPIGTSRWYGSLVVGICG
jgi:hypothetical protein